MMSIAFLAALAICAPIVWKEVIRHRASRVEREVFKERQRIAAYLRRHSLSSERISKDPIFLPSSRDQEGYVAEVLGELSDEISLGEHVRISE
jgi:hypothetical protein